MSDSVTKKYIDSLSNGLSYSSSVPNTPLCGEFCFDTTDDTLKYYDGTTWVTLVSGGSVQVSQVKENRNSTIDELLLEAKDDEIKELKNEIKRLNEL